MEARREELHAWQRFYNMAPRSDSKLTERFLAGEVQWSVPEVARELAATHFLHTQTCYGVVLEDFMRAMANHVRERHRGISWSATWELVCFYGPLALKLLAVLRGSTRIPRLLPPPLNESAAHVPPDAPNARAVLDPPATSCSYAPSTT